MLTTTVSDLTIKVCLEDTGMNDKGARTIRLKLCVSFLSLDPQWLLMIHHPVILHSVKECAMNYHTSHNRYHALGALVEERYHHTFVLEWRHSGLFFPVWYSLILQNALASFVSAAQARYYTPGLPKAGGNRQ